MILFPPEVSEFLVDSLMLLEAVKLTTATDSQSKEGKSLLFAMTGSSPLSDHYTHI